MHYTQRKELLNVCIHDGFKICTGQKQPLSCGWQDAQPFVTWHGSQSIMCKIYRYLVFNGLMLIRLFVIIKINEIGFNIYKKGTVIGFVTLVECAHFKHVREHKHLRNMNR